MSPWLYDHLNYLLSGALGTVLLGIASLFVRASVRQSVRLYQAKLVDAQKAIESRDLEIEGLKEIIALQDQRSEVRKGLVEDLMDQVDRLRESTSNPADTTSRTMSSPSGSSPRRSKSERS